jgi:hypothetical protein
MAEGAWYRGNSAENFTANSTIPELPPCLASCRALRNLVDMNTSTLTIRLPKEQREALRRCARALKKTESEYIRDLLARDLDSRTLTEQIGDLAGSLDSSQTVGKPHPLKEVIRKRNWRK